MLVRADDKLFVLQIRELFVHSQQDCHTLLFICIAPLISTTKDLTEVSDRVSFLHQHGPHPPSLKRLFPTQTVCQNLEGLKPVLNSEPA
jgi:hypothetical protein